MLNCGHQFLQYQQSEESHKKTKYISVYVIIFTFEILGIKETNVSSQGSQPCLRSPLSERGDPYVWYVRRVWRYQRGGQNA
jgi:hypothetical protein